MKKTTQQIIIILLVLISIPTFIFSLPLWMLWGIYKQNWTNKGKALGVFGAILVWSVLILAYSNTDAAKRAAAEQQERKMVEWRKRFEEAKQKVETEQRAHEEALRAEEEKQKEQEKIETE